MRAGAGSRSSARVSTCTTSLLIRGPARCTPAASIRAPGGRPTAVRTGRGSGDSTSSGVIESSPIPRRRNASTSPRSEGASGTGPQRGIRLPPKMSWSPRGSSDAANWYSVSLAARPVPEGTERAEFTTEQRSQRRTNGEDDGGRSDAWGVTPAVAGVRVARAATGTSGPHEHRNHLCPWRPSSLDRAPRGHAHGRLRLLRFVFVCLRCSVCELRCLRNLPRASAPASRQSI